jgi:NitT/TauT family transport system substrate-binding protein
MSIRGLAAGAAVAVVVAAGCGSSPEQHTAGGRAASARQTVKVGLPGTANATSGYLAGKRFFRGAGLSFAPVAVTRGAEAIPMLLNGKLDIALGDGMGTLTAAGNGVPLRVIGVATVAPADAKLDPTALVTADRGITAAGLAGKSVAVSQLGGAPELVAKSAIDADGGDSAAVKFVELDAAQMVAALKAHRVDGALLTEPHATAAEQQGLPILSRPQSLGEPGLPSTLWVTSERYAAEHPDVIKKFVAAVQSGGREANTDPAGARKVAATFMAVDPRVLQAIRFPLFADDVADTASVRKFVDLANRYKAFPKQPDLDRVLAGGSSS